ncbi:hypothetical protein GCM10010121_007130 [Streptomyces brasiliensis]|uniref:Uncharacterized protein n=1 Tax=Streptomyces brasiliensis TaxID=1954 RepID=A0A917NGU6_9ACTN|nr:hypothetical protein GCM10010121_007130 [Streptomyces brasiliensis]
MCVRCCEAPCDVGEPGPPGRYGRQLSAQSATDAARLRETAERLTGVTFAAVRGDRILHTSVATDQDRAMAGGSLRRLRE